MRVRIKMCGTTRKQDADAAVELGVDALGFIFADKSPRYVTPELAASLLDDLPPFISRVGVFVDSGLEQIKETVRTAGLTQVQLHGKESADFCAELQKWNRSLVVCKAFLVGKESLGPDVSSYLDSIDCLLFDTYVKGMDGGTGQAFDWRTLKGLKVDLPIILAGGLNPDNVAEAILSTTPYAIDINSGVEESPGVKSHELLSRLVDEVRKIEYALTTD
ncbi:MAG: phosphoribosylanthranilate isomerase [Desulfocapsaceae bacterium]